MADAILYRSTDAGAPTPVGGSGYAIERFYQFIVPCLVTGYGTGATAKAGQGWTVEHANLPTGFTLKSPDGVYYVFHRNTDNTNTAHGFMAYMAESITTLGAYPPVGVNVRSSHYSADYNASYANRHWMHLGGSSNANNHWAVVARGSQVLIITTTETMTSSNGGNPQLSSAYGAMMLFGNIKMRDPSAPKNGPQNSFIIGGTGIYSTTYSSTASYTSFQLDGVHTRLRDPVSGAVEVASLTTCYGNPYSYGNQTYYKIDVDVYPPDLNLKQTDCWLSGTGAIGWVPGLFFMDRLSHYRSDKFLIAMGRGGQSFGDTIEPFTIGGEPFYYIPNSAGGVMVSTLEKYWA